MGDRVEESEEMPWSVSRKESGGGETSGSVVRQSCIMKGTVISTKK